MNPNIAMLIGIEVSCHNLGVFLNSTRTTDLQILQIHKKEHKSSKYADIIWCKNHKLGITVFHLETGFAFVLDR